MSTKPASPRKKPLFMAQKPSNLPTQIPEDPYYLIGGPASNYSMEEVVNKSATFLIFCGTTDYPSTATPSSFNWMCQGLGAGGAGGWNAPWNGKGLNICFVDQHIEFVPFKNGNSKWDQTAPNVWNGNPGYAIFGP